MLLARARTAFRHAGRFLSSQSHPTPKSASNPTQNPTFTRLLNRTPKFLRPTVSALHSAPITHITAFLILHEITAIVPLVGLAGAFHYYQWLPPYFAEGAWVVAGVEKFGRYFKRKGWVEAGEEAEAERRAKEGQNVSEIEKTKSVKWWDRGENGVRWIIEFATAYAMVKALLPVRIFVSVWGAPWFARWTVIPFSNGAKRLFASRKGGGSSAINQAKGKPTVVSSKTIQDVP